MPVYCLYCNWILINFSLVFSDRFLNHCYFIVLAYLVPQMLQAIILSSLFRIFFTLLHIITDIQTYPAKHVWRAVRKSLQELNCGVSQACEQKRKLVEPLCPVSGFSPLYLFLPINLYVHISPWYKLQIYRICLTNVRSLCFIHISRGLGELKCGFKVLVTSS